MTLVNGWVDVHAHFSPPSTEEERQKKYDSARNEKFMLSEPFHWTPGKTLEYMDRTGIAMQFLSNIPKDHATLRRSNEYAASLVTKYPKRFGLFMALPTDDADACLDEIKRSDELRADGFAVTCHYNGVYLGDKKLERVWEELNRRSAVVHAHPDAWAPASLGRPAPVIEVALYVE